MVGMVVIVGLGAFALGEVYKAAVGLGWARRYPVLKLVVAAVGALGGALLVEPPHAVRAVVVVTFGALGVALMAHRLFRHWRVQGDWAVRQILLSQVPSARRGVDGR